MLLTFVQLQIPTFVECKNRLINRLPSALAIVIEVNFSLLSLHAECSVEFGSTSRDCNRTCGRDKREAFDATTGVLRAPGQNLSASQCCDVRITRGTVTRIRIRQTPLRNLIRAIKSRDYTREGDRAASCVRNGAFLEGEILQIRLRVARLQGDCIAIFR